VTEAGTWARRRHRRPRPPRQPTRGRTCEGGGREHQSNQQHLCSTSCVVPGALAIRAPLPSASWGEGCRSGAGEQPRGVCQDSVLLVRLPASPAWCCMAQCPRDKAATNKLRIVTCGFGTARQKWPLNDGQIPNPNVVRVALGTGYHRVEGNRRASRNGRVSDLPPETPIHYDSQLVHRWMRERGGHVPSARGGVFERLLRPTITIRNLCIAGCVREAATYRARVVGSLSASSAACTRCTASLEPAPSPVLSGCVCTTTWAHVRACCRGNLVGFN
jgi:hypothetical protein